MANNAATLAGYAREPMEVTLMREAEDIAHGRRLRAAMGLLTPTDLAQLLDLSVETIKRWQNQHLGPTPIKIGQKISLYDADTVRAWIHQHVNEQAEDDEENV